MLCEQRGCAWGHNLLLSIGCLLPSHPPILHSPPKICQSNACLYAWCRALCFCGARAVARYRTQLLSIRACTFQPMENLGGYQFCNPIEICLKSSVEKRVHQRVVAPLAL